MTNVLGLEAVGTIVDSSGYLAFYIIILIFTLIKCVHFFNTNELMNIFYWRKEGMRALALLAGGGQAEYVSVNKGHILEIPDELSFESAAAIAETWITAY